MWYKISDTLNAIASQIGNATTINIVPSGSLRGAHSSTTGNGLFVYKSGFVDGSVSGGTLTITLEGGNSDFDNALNNDIYSPGFTRAQYTVVNAIIDFAIAHNPAIVIHSDII